jgi:hypothetical protein
MRGFSKSSERPMVPLKTKFSVNTNAKNVVVKEASILQEIAFAKLLIGFSIYYSPFLATLFIEHYVSIINPFQILRSSSSMLLIFSDVDMFSSPKF